jgi:A/G-specific adenine glycosylase
MPPFAEQLLEWFDAHGRKDLPWQRNPTPYRVWVSEIMLQQTQVTTVIAYYERFMERFPDIAALAGAPLDVVLHLWSGLGYYARARNLHRAAIEIVSRHNGVFPEVLADVESLPGIGRSTAGAILSLSLGQRHPILDGNVKRVLTRWAGIEGFPGTRQVELKLWELAERLTPDERSAAYTQAIMDLGATVCVRSRPLCTACPVARECLARAQGSQERLPGPRPRKARKQKAAHVVIAVESGGAVLLERRPPSGIWGGLWSFPQFENEVEATQWALLIAGERGQQKGDREPGTGESEDREADGGQRTVKRQTPRAANSLKPSARAPALSHWPTLHHSFTHFDLALHPLVLSPVMAGQQVADEDRYCWYDPRDPAEVGLAAPVAELIKAVAASRPDEG